MIAQPGTNLQKKQNKSEKKKFIRDLRMTVGPGAVQSKKNKKKNKKKKNKTQEHVDWNKKGLNC